MSVQTRHQPTLAGLRPRRAVRPWLVAALLPVMLAVTSCSASSSETTQASDAGSDHNAADVAFATAMIPHHAQAVEMADLALSRTTSAAVHDLAQQIQDAQGPEIDTMSGWLADWDQPIPATTGGMDGMDGMGEGSHTMPGMMSSKDMQDLAAAPGKEFDRMWLTMMVQHHEGAIEMARTELSDGRSSAAKDLATAMVTAQQKEIGVMTGLLAAP